jgi:hypothetical protein
MVAIRNRKIFPGDLKSSTIPTDFNKYTRIARIVSVDPANGVCRIQWLDRPGFRENVLLTQGSDGEWNIPRKDSVVIVAFDPKDQARIIRYINVGHSPKISSYELPALSEGEKYWECAGASIYITATGDIILRSASLGTVTLDKGSDTFKTDTTNLRLITVGGDIFFGQVKRFKTQLDGSKLSEVINNIEGNAYVEYTFNLYETDSDRNSLISVTPLIKATLGTDIDGDGNVVDENDSTVIDDRESVCLKFIITKDSAEVLSLKINKKGEVTAKLPKLVLNNGASATDIIINSGTKGVARLDDEIEVEISNLVSNDVIRGSGLTDGTPHTYRGKIIQASNSVKVGD